MLPIQVTCQPRLDILQGSFNPEIFTASLSQVMDHLNLALSWQTGGHTCPLYQGRGILSRGHIPH
jgi:hypothetical protein